MPDKFCGFSQEEINRVSGIKQNQRTAIDAMKPIAFRGHGGIRRLSEKKESPHQQKNSQTRQHQVAPTNTNSKKKQNTNNKIFEEHDGFQSNDSFGDINIDSSISKSLEEALFYQPLKCRQKNDKKALTVQEKHLQDDENPVQTQNNMPTQSTSASSECGSILKLSSDMDSQISCSSSTNNLDDSSILPSLDDCNRKPACAVSNSPNMAPAFKGISLKDFELHRKMIEEQNRQKKEILNKAIEQHSQKTAAEARKIEEIKAELAKLDNDLAVDVALLRKQIENACIHFATVEKHYLKIESQFLKAKIDLHNASEKKELLTEHLCTVIVHNEDRKSKKLTELMEKVGLATNKECESPTSTLK